MEKVQSKQYKLKLPLVNFDQIIDGRSKKKKAVFRHSPLLPNSIRCIVCGPSNCGKTNAVFNLLFADNGLRFENLYVFSKSLYQEKYRFLSDLMAQVPEIGFYPFGENEEVIAPAEAKPNSVIIFDDVACEKQNNIRSYFAMGRHNNIDSFYVCQTYSKVPKQLVRDNANFLIVFRQDELNLKHIYRDHVNTDMALDTFKRLCGKAWNDKPHGFIIINKECDLDNGRYRFGFDEFINHI